VAKALRLVELVAAGPTTGMTLSELARSLGTSKSAAYALARTLVDAGHLRAVEPGPHYLLGMSLVRLGDVAGQRLPLSRLAAPILQDLNQATGLTIRIAVVDDGYPVFVDRVDGSGTVRFHAPLGVRELPHTSSAGKAILSSLDAAEVARIGAECGLPPRTRKSITDVEALLADLAVTRRRGYAVDDEEDVDGVFCVAAPFRPRDALCRRAECDRNQARSARLATRGTRPHRSDACRPADRPARRNCTHVGGLSARARRRRAWSGGVAGRRRAGRRAG
jgi:IclR family acetate operon transcriptional repressor